MSIARDADIIFQKMEAIRKRWPGTPEGRFRWRAGRAAFMQVVDWAVGPAPDHALDDLGPRFASIAREEDARWAERRRALTEAWGKDTARLFGWPVVCDEDFEGIEPEVVFP